MLHPAAVFATCAQDRGSPLPSPLHGFYRDLHVDQTPTLGVPLSVYVRKSAEGLLPEV